MPIITGCCCFPTLKRGSRASAMFTFVTALCNMAIDISIIVRLHRLDKTMEPQEKFIYFPPGIFPLMCIELVLSIALIALGVVLLIGINFNYDGKPFIYAWLYGIVADRLYDVFIGVYVLSWIGGHRFDDVIYVVPESIVIAVYWLLNSLILIAAIICVLSYWQEQNDDLYGKQRRIQYYKILANIRTAALSGGATPLRSHYASKTTLVSQGTVNQGYVQKY